MYGVVPKVLWSRLVEPDDQNRISLQTNCLMLERDGERVLIETGFGDKVGEKERSIFAMESRSIGVALAEIDVEPESIDLVVLTHLHFDHAAGITRVSDGQVVPTFPNARIVVQQTEWDDALANKSTMTRTYLRDHLDPVVDQIECVAGEVELRPGLTVWPMPGHTWGQQAIRFRDDAGTVVFAGDVLPTINHAGLAFSLAYDMEPYTNQLSKRDLLTQAADESWRLVLDHEPGEPVVRVRRDPGRAGQFELIPAGVEAVG